MFIIRRKRKTKSTKQRVKISLDEREKQNTMFMNNKVT